MKNILLLVHDDDGQEARLQVALDVARGLEGHLHCVDVCLLPVAADACFDGTAAAVLYQEERKREDSNRARLEARLAHEDVSWSYVDATGSIPQCLEPEAALADLIVVNRGLDDFPLPDMRAAAGEVILKTRKPILAVPQHAKGLDVRGRALVAWDGSAASAAALRAAVPLLKLAREVLIVEVADGSIEVPLEEAAEYLSRHDIHASIRRIPAAGRRTDEVILREIEDVRADYVVLGGFGHHRFQEALFGGVTRTILTRSPVPALLAH